MPDYIIIGVCIFASFVNALLIGLTIYSFIRMLLVEKDNEHLSAENKRLKQETCCYWWHHGCMKPNGEKK